MLKLRTLIVMFVLFALTACGGGATDSEESGSNGDNTGGVTTPAPEPQPEPAPEPEPEPEPEPAPEPEQEPEPEPEQEPELEPEPMPPITGPVEEADQCDTTAQCRATYGDIADDCANSQSEQSICMCGTERCDSMDPVDPPTDPEPPVVTEGECAIGGVLQQWHRVELVCDGFAASETDETTFTDYRFNVTFSQGGEEYVVPGHFAADGNAADNGATDGDVWRAYFLPPSTGEWEYDVSFRTGDGIAVSLNENEGEAVEALDGISGVFNVSATTASGRDMRARGLLQHNQGERYLRFAGDGTVFISAGMDSPENIFGYSEFDNTTKHLDSANSCKGILHDFSAHEEDWQNGDPTWAGNRGKSLIGLVNYIASTGVNAIYIMANTVKGDGCDAHPWSEYNSTANVKRFDVSKLDQWERVLSHMTQKGIFIHLLTQETENDQLLNGGDLGLERKLFYRELISRFAHHPALQWNLGEENTNTDAQRIAFTHYIRDLDPYEHPIVMHTYPGEKDEYLGLLGEPKFDGATLQYGAIPEEDSAESGVYGGTIHWMTESAEAGYPWVVTVTEASGAHAPKPNESVTDRQRIYWMWANIMAGGGGFEWYLKNAGAGHAYDLAVEDLREFDQHWLQSGYIATFFRDTLQKALGVSLHSLQRDNSVTSITSDWVLADPGVAYLIYLRDGGQTSLTLPDNAVYEVRWFNPRTGETTLADSIQGQGDQDLGHPPSDSSLDWVVVVTASDGDAFVHPDIVRVLELDEENIVNTPTTNWQDSYSVGDRCYCDTTFDHNIGDVMVETNQGTMTVSEACAMVGPGPGAAGRPRYNDVQCGNGPANDAGDEEYCPGRVDMGKAGCGHIGPEWILPEQPDGLYVESDGLVIMEAENTLSDLDQWSVKTNVSGYTGTGYIEFGGNTPINGPATSPLEYTFKVNQSGYYYLYMYVARETVEINGETRTDVANDGYIRLEGDFSAGPNVGNNHGDDAPLNNLKNNTKYFGGADFKFAWATGNRLDLGGHNNKRVPVYQLTAGETYTFVLSGRSQYFKVDRIVFAHESASGNDAKDLSKGETR